MQQRRIGQHDADTGEILENATLAVFYPKRKNGFTTGWLAMAQEPLMKLAQANLGDEARRVLFALLAKLDFENYLVLNQAELGRELKLKPPSVNRAITKLMTEGVVLPGPKISRNKTYTLNPHYGWKGSAKNHNEALKARMRAAGLSVVKSGTPPPLPDDLEQQRDTQTLDLF